MSALARGKSLRLFVGRFGCRGSWVEPIAAVGSSRTIEIGGGVKVFEYGSWSDQTYEARCLAVRIDEKRCGN